jgi:sugar lactone lactonase YvrE
VRWDPRTGRALQTVSVPAPRVTSCAFGGQRYETLFITTARSGLEPAQLEAWPLSGGLFAIEPGVGGLPSHRFKED